MGEVPGHGGWYQCLGAGYWGVGAGTRIRELVLGHTGQYWGVEAGTGIRDSVLGYGGWYRGRCLLGEAGDRD